MKKSNVLFLFALILALLYGGYLLIRPYWRLPFDKMSPFEAISINSSLAIGFDVITQPEDSLYENHLWALDVKRLNELLDSFDFKDENLWAEWWMIPEQIEQGGEVSYTFIGSSKQNLVWSNKLDKHSTSMNYSDGEVYGFGLTSTDPLYFTTVSNLLIVGKYPFQVEETLSLLKNKNENWYGDEKFKDLLDLTKQNTSTQEAIINSDGLLIDLPEGWISSTQERLINKHLDWAWLEIEKNDTVGLFLAYLALKNTQEYHFSASSDWSEVPELCMSAIPLLLHKPSTANEWMKYIAPWKANGGWELTMDNELQSDDSAKEIWVLPIADTSIYHKNYAELIENAGVLDRIDYQGFELIQLNTNPVFSPLSDRKGLQMWLCELDGALLCSVSRKDMERWLDYYIVGGQMDKETSFVLQQQNLKTEGEAQVLWKWNPLDDHETNLLKLFFPLENWANSGQVVASVAANQSEILMLEGSIINYEPSIVGPSVAWTIPLEMKGEIELFPVKNIYTQQTIAFVVQDESGYLAFYDQNGNVFWDIENVAPLLGELYALPWHDDILHLLATTRDGMRLWDENGIRIDRLPVIPAVPSGTMHIARFGQKDQLGVFVPTADGQIWGFKPSGELLDGWPVTVYQNDTLISSILHYQLPTQDLIVSWTDSVGWKAFDKKGNLYFSVDKLNANPIGLPFGQQLSDDGLPANNRLVMAYENGVAQIVSFSGESFGLPLGKGPANHFMFNSIWGDPRGDYIVHRGRLIHLFGYDNDEFTERWQHYFTTAPDSIISLAPYGLVSMDFDKKELLLLDGNGEMLSEYPLAGHKNAFLLNTTTHGVLLLTLLDQELYAYQLDSF